MRDPFYGAIEGVNDQDYIFGGELNIPTPTLTYDKSRIQYNQVEVSSMSCTLHAALGAISDLTGYEFSLPERIALWKQALEEGASNTEGWYIYKAVDLARNYWNAHNADRLVSYRVNLSEANYVIDKGYSLVVGFKGNANYSNDIKDGTLDEVELSGNPTYVHSIRLHKTNTVRAVDNYEGNGHNEYRVKDLPKLISNKVFFNEAYFFVSLNDAEKEKNKVSDWAKDSVEKCLKTKIATIWSNPQEIVASPVAEKMLFNAKVLKSYSGQGVTKERLAKVMDRLGLLTT